MNKSLLVLLLATGLIFPPIVKTYGDTEQDNNKLSREAFTIDNQTQSQEGRQAFVDRVKDQFGIDETQVQSLRQRNLGYGEIGIVYALAAQMTGGVNDENVRKIMDLRQNEPGNTGWGNIAKSLNLNLGHVQSRLDKITRTSGEKPSMQEQTGSPVKSQGPSHMKSPMRSSQY